MFLANGYTLLYICLWTRALLAELDALEGIIVRSIRLCIRRRIQLELAFIFFPEILTALSRLVVLGISGRIGFLAGGVRLLCRSRAGGRAISVFRREKSQEYLAALGPRSCDTLTL